MGLMSFGWDGSDRTWHRYETVYLLLAGLATPLVFSVHTIVSMDFATAVIPGWHTTIFPPYFVAGAIFSGLAMVLTLMIIARKSMHLEDYITLGHVDRDVQADALDGLHGGAGLRDGVLSWPFTAGNGYEQFVFFNDAAGPFGWAYWTMVCATWSFAATAVVYGAFGATLPLVFVLSIVVNIGMWFERFVIIVTSLHRDYLAVELGDLFADDHRDRDVDRQFRIVLDLLFLLFCRFVPMIAIAEVKGAAHLKKPQIARRHVVRRRARRKPHESRCHLPRLTTKTI